MKNLTTNNMLSINEHLVWESTIVSSQPFHKFTINSFDLCTRLFSPLLLCDYRIDWGCIYNLHLFLSLHWNYSSVYYYFAIFILSLLKVRENSESKILLCHTDTHQILSKLYCDHVTYPGCPCTIEQALWVIANKFPG